MDSYISAIESIERLRRVEGYSRDETLMMAKSFLALGDIFSEIDHINAEDKDQVYNEALRLVVPLNRETPDNMGIAILMCHSLTRLARLELDAGHRRDGYKLSVRGVDVLIEALKSNPDSINGYLQLAEARLGHLRFLDGEKNTARLISERGVESATSARDAFVKTAESLSEPERDRIENRFREVFSAYGKFAEILGRQSSPLPAKISPW